MKQKTVMAVDLGASNGRCVCSLFDGKQISLQEISRFPNRSLNADGLLKWDILHLYGSILDASRKALSMYPHIDSMGIDAWGLDVGLLDQYGMLLSNPIHYVSDLTLDILPKMDAEISAKERFEQTGIQSSRLKTLSQLFAIRRSYPEWLEHARQMLFIPNLLLYFLSGETMNETSVASTSQMLAAGGSRWNSDLVSQFGIHPRILSPLRMGGTQVMHMQEKTAKEIGHSIPLALTFGHDTACAFMAAPLRKNRFSAILSCGTRGILGVETNDCIINDHAFAFQFSNEVGADGTIRFLQSVSGLWAFQQLCGEFASDHAFADFALCQHQAEQADAFVCLINLDDDRILQQGTMSEKIQRYCRETHQSSPQSRAELLRCVLESLALSYARIVEQLECCAQKKLDCIHVVGGGGKNRLLMQFVANATGKTLFVGPYEASSLGNVFGQLMAAGECRDRWEAREIIAHSYEVEQYEPQCTEKWKEVYMRYCTLLSRGNEKGF